jgi:hypothetical protein
MNSKLRTAMLLSVAVAHAGCSLAMTATPPRIAASSSASTSAAASTSAGASTSASAGGGATPVAPPDPADGYEQRRLRRTQFAHLRGMTPDNARIELKRLGHVGPVTVRALDDSRYDAKCGAGLVCAIATTSYTMMEADDPVELLINPTLTIAPPPP